MTAAPQKQPPATTRPPWCVVTSASTRVPGQTAAAVGRVIHWAPLALETRWPGLRTVTMRGEGLVRTAWCDEVLLAFQLHGSFNRCLFILSLFVVRDICCVQSSCSCENTLVVCFSPLAPYMARMLPQPLLVDNRMSSTGIKGLRSVVARGLLAFPLLLFVSLAPRFLIQDSPDVILCG